MSDIGIKFGKDNKPQLKVSQAGQNAMRRTLAIAEVAASHGDEELKKEATATQEAIKKLLVHLAK